MRKQAGNIDKEAKQGSRKLSVRATWDHEQFRFLSELMSVMDGGLLVVGVSGVDRVAGMQTRVSAVLFSRQGQLFWQEACAPQASCLDHQEVATLSPFWRHLQRMLAWTSTVRPKYRPVVSVTEDRSFARLVEPQLDERNALLISEWRSSFGLSKLERDPDGWRKQRDLEWLKW